MNEWMNEWKNERERERKKEKREKKIPPKSPLDWPWLPLPEVWFASHWVTRSVMKLFKNSGLISLCLSPRRNVSFISARYFWSLIDCAVLSLPLSVPNEKSVYLFAVTLTWPLPVVPLAASKLLMLNIQIRKNKLAQKIGKCLKNSIDKKQWTLNYCVQRRK